jgi:hypothetical protein
MGFKSYNILIVLNILLVLLIIVNSVCYVLCKREKYEDEEQENPKIVFKDMTISHPDGRVWRNDLGIIRLNKGTPIKLSIYSDPGVLENEMKRYALLQNGSLHHAIEHYYFTLRSSPFRPNDINFPWAFHRIGENKVNIWNPWNKGWYIGYDAKKDNLLIVKHENRVAWEVDKMPPVEYIALL